MKFLLEKLIIFLKMYYFYFYTILKVVLHLQLLPNIWLFPMLDSPLLYPNLQQIVCTFHFLVGFVKEKAKSFVRKNRMIVKKTGNI